VAAKYFADNFEPIDAPAPAALSEDVLREILAAEYRKAGSTIPFEKHEEFEGPWIKICLAAMSEAVRRRRSE
jgi:hypothetical protein